MRDVGKPNNSNKNRSQNKPAYTAASCEVVEVLETFRDVDGRLKTQVRLALRPVRA